MHGAYEHFKEGGWGMWPILFTSVVTIAIIVERAVYLFRASVDKDTVYVGEQVNLTLTITLVPLVITTTSLPDGQIGTAYSSTLTSSGGTGAVTWTRAAGTLPAGAERARLVRLSQSQKRVAQLLGLIDPKAAFAPATRFVASFCDFFSERYWLTVLSTDSL